MCERALMRHVRSRGRHWSIAALRHTAGAPPNPEIFAEEPHINALAAMLNLRLVFRRVEITNCRNGVQQEAIRQVGRLDGCRIDMVHWCRNGDGVHFDLLRPGPGGGDGVVDLTEAPSARAAGPAAQRTVAKTPREKKKTSAHQDNPQQGEPGRPSAPAPRSPPAQRPPWGNGTKVVAANTTSLLRTFWASRKPAWARSPSGRPFAGCRRPGTRPSSGSRSHQCAPAAASETPPGA